MRDKQEIIDMLTTSNTKKKEAAADMPFRNGQALKAFKKALMWVLQES